MPRIAIRDIELNFEQRGSGPPLLLVHGFPLDHGMWRNQLDELAGTCRVIAPDLRGFGLSEVTRGTVSMPRFADDLSELLDALDVDEPVTLCGLSMGGYIAWEFWRRHASRLDRLILCDTRAMADTPEAAGSRIETATRVLAEGPGLVAESMIPKLFCERTVRERPEIVQQVKQMMAGTAADGVAAALRGMAERDDFQEQLPDIDLPALVICGRYDAISPVGEMREMAARLPRATFVEIEDAGHMAPLENPLDVNRAIRQFLSERG